MRSEAHLRAFRDQLAEVLEGLPLEDWRVLMMHRQLCLLGFVLQDDTVGNFWEHVVLEDAREVRQAIEEETKHAPPT